MVNLPETGPHRRRVAIGPRRPQYLSSRESDRLLMVITALVVEVAALRDRVASHEEVAEAGVAATRSAIEAHRPDAGQAGSRKSERTALLKRVYRVITEELDAVRQVEDRRATPWSMPDEWDRT